jgi:hypothetical protein
MPEYNCTDARKLPLQPDRSKPKNSNLRHDWQLSVAREEVRGLSFQARSQNDIVPS